MENSFTFSRFYLYNLFSKFPLNSRKLLLDYFLNGENYYQSFSLSVDRLVVYKAITEASELKAVKIAKNSQYTSNGPILDVFSVLESLARHE